MTSPRLQSDKGPEGVAGITPPLATGVAIAPSAEDGGTTAPSLTNAPAHTPLPWKVTNLTDIFTMNGAADADGKSCADNDGWQIADCAVGVTSVDNELLDLTSKEQRANAAFIVRACNAHYAMLFTLEILLTEYEHEGSRTTNAGPWPLVRAAIAKATTPA